MIAIQSSSGLIVQNGGLFISRGVGRHPRRILDTWELIFVESGVLSIREEKETYKVGPGQYVFLAPGKIHEGTDDYPADLKFFWVHFSLLSSEVFSSKTEMNAVTLPIYNNVKDKDVISSLFRLFLSEQMENSCVELLNVTLLLIFKKIYTSVSIDNKIRNENVLVRQTTAYIRTHFHHPISTSKIAARLNCNPDYLGRLFRKHRGRTVTDEINFQRVKSAEGMLVTSLMSLAEIARRSGFSDLGYFREIFKKYKGVTPKKWRGLYSRIHVNSQ